MHPAETTRTNIDKMKEQIRAIGGLYDLDVNLETSSLNTQMDSMGLFAALQKGLA